jgi:drug/metabolite transporter (DMT)-like permease
LAVYGTVLPSYLMAWGMRRVEPHKFAIICTTGPVSTLALAWWFLGEVPSGLQGAGMTLTIVSGMLMGVFQSPATRNVKTETSS